MAFSAPIFHTDVVYILNLLVALSALVLGAIAFIHCVTQRSDAFPAIGTLPKGGWLAILGVLLLLTLVARSFIIFPLILIGAAMVYMLDVRVGLRDISDGKGFW